MLEEGLPLEGRALKWLAERALTSLEVEEGVSSPSFLG